MVEHEAKFAGQMFETMPEQVKEMILFCTSAVEWSWDDRWRFEGVTMSLREKATDLYKAIQNLENDEENLSSKLIKYSDLYNKLQKEFTVLKNKYDPKRELLKDQESSEKNIGNLKLWRVCYEYKDAYDVDQDISKYGLFTPEEMEQVIEESCTFKKFEFEKPEKRVNFSFTFNLFLGERCKLGHDDKIKVQFEISFSKGHSESGFELNIQEVYDENKYAADSFAKNNFIQFFLDHYNRQRKKLKLSGGKQLDCSENSQQKLHMDDKCCQRDMMLYVVSKDVEDLKEIIRIFLKYFIEHPKEPIKK